MRRAVWVLAVLLAAAGFGGLASGWWVKGHETITEAAAARLPDELPSFFRAGGKHLAHFAGDPDRWKNRETPTLRAAEEGHHFLDLEDLGGKPLPPNSRFAGMDLMRSLKKEPNKVGLLPYAIQEGYEKLACAFADYRKYPESESVRMKCLVYAGNLAHYTTDASMPLHTTIHYDGRVPEGGGEKKQKGIHAKLDGFPEKFKLTAEEMSRGIDPQPVVDVWDHTTKFLAESFTHIDKSYELDAAGAFETPTPESRAFVLARCRAGARFTAEIWWAAWRKSEKLPPPY